MFFMRYSSQYQSNIVAILIYLDNYIYLSITLKTPRFFFFLCTTFEARRFVFVLFATVWLPENESKIYECLLTLSK